MSLHTTGARPLAVTATLALVFAAAISTAVPASASSPDIQKLPPGESTSESASCGFTVRIDVLARPGMVKTFFDAAGMPRTTHVSGAFTGTLTRLLDDGSAGPSIRVNFSGPGNFDPATGNLSSRGPWLLEGPGYMLLVRGQAEVSSGSTGPIVNSTTGNVTDLCAALA